MDDILAVTITAGDRADAETIAAALVGERLAACAQLLPIDSWYRWEGKVRRDAEVMLVVKTVRARLPALEARVLALHGYAVPEVIAMPVVGGSAAYLDWVRQAVAGDS